MLLKRIANRIAKGFKDQDWFVVIVEVLIVVVGIFVGLQVDDWNQRRLDTNLGKEYVDDIKKSVQADLEMLAILEIDILERQMAAKEVLLVMENGVIENAGLFLRYVDKSGRFRAPVYDRSVFEDLIATGNARLIPVSLNKDIIDYYRLQINSSRGDRLQERRVWEDYLPMAVSAMSLDSQAWVYTQLDNKLIATDDIEVHRQDAANTLSALAQNPKVPSALKAVVRGTWSQLRWIDRIRLSAEGLLRKIDRVTSENTNL